MIELAYSLAGAILAAVAALGLARRRVARVREQASLELGRATATQQADATAELAAQRERTARMVASLKAEISALRQAATDAAHDASDDRARRAHEATAEQTSLAPAPRDLAQWLSKELATIVSGIEGGTFQLIESAPVLRAETYGVESLWLAVRRLRRFHDKVQAYARALPPTVGVTAIDLLLTDLRDELSTTALGLQIAWNLPQTSLSLRGSQDELVAALTFTCKALRHLERPAMRLSIQVEPGFDSDMPLALIELTLERDEAPDSMASATAPTVGFLVARCAAQNVLRALGGTVAFVHEPGHEARALLRIPLQTPDWAAATPATAPTADVVPASDERSATEQAQHEMDLAADLAAAPAAFGMTKVDADRTVSIPRRHRYGGVLVIEGDPAVRSMLASELKAQGRSVFACSDGAAARSLIQATPDRFEVLVVDQAARFDAGDLLASTVARLCPDMRVFVLSELDQQLVLAPDLLQRVTQIRKPFGVHELRRALAAALLP